MVRSRIILSKLPTDEPQLTDVSMPRKENAVSDAPTYCCSLNKQIVLHYGDGHDVMMK